MSPSLSRAREPRASPSRLTLTTGIRLSRSPRRVAIRSSRSARRPRRPLTPSRSHGVRISPTRSPLPPSPFRACPCPCLSPLIAPIYLLRVYLSFFSPLSRSLRPFSPCPSRSRWGREIRSNTRGDVPSTPCAVCRRGARGDSTEWLLSPLNGGAPLFFSFSHAGTHSLPVLLPDNKRINVTLRRFSRACLSSRIQT